VVLDTPAPQTRKCPSMGAEWRVRMMLFLILWLLVVLVLLADLSLIAEVKKGDPEVLGKLYLLVRR